MTVPDDDDKTASEYESSITISGMGELHLEVTKHRIENDYPRIGEIYMGPLQISYKEGLTKKVSHECVAEKTINGVPCKARVAVCLTPLEVEHVGRARSNPIEFRTGNVVETKETAWNSMRRDYLIAAENGARQACSTGPLGGYSLVDVRVVLTELIVDTRTLPSFVAMAASTCVNEALRMAGTVLLEPMMDVAVTVDVKHSAAGRAVIAQRRGQVQYMETLDEETSVVEAQMPLAAMEHFSRDMRTATSGFASFTVSLGRYSVAETYPSHMKRTVQS